MANIGRTDKVLRIIVGLVLLGFSFISLGGLSSTLGLVVILVGVVLIVTALANFCPLYRILGIGTLGKTDR